MKRVRILLLLSLLGACAGCAHQVRFNEKERLADRTMIFDYDFLGSEMRGHMITPREASLGGFTGTVGAGGCGCN
jgi:hypothetical protein